MCFIISSPIFTCVMSFCDVIFAVSYAKQSVSIHVCVIHAWRVIQFNICIYDGCNHKQWKDICNI